MSSTFRLPLLLSLLSLLLLVVPSHAALQYTFHLMPNIPYRPPFASRLLAGNTAMFNVSLANVTLSTHSMKVAVSPLGAQLPGLYGDFVDSTTATTARFRQAAVPLSKASGDIPFFNFTAVEAGASTMLYITVSCPVGGEAACSFIISATTHNRMAAWPGFLNFDKLPAGHVQYYDYAPSFFNSTGYPRGGAVNATLAADDVHITANVLRGRISIYVISTPLPGTTLPFPNNATWRQVNYNNEVLIIPAGDTGGQRNARISQQFIIAVVADDAQTTADNHAVYGLQVSYRALLNTNNGVPEAVIIDSCRWLSDDLPTPGMSLAVSDWDEYCFVAPTPVCSMDITLTTYGGEQDIYLWSNGGFSAVDAVFNTESDNLHKTQTAATFYAVIVYTPYVQGRFTPGRYNILFHTNCTAPFGTQSVERLPASSAPTDDGSSSVTVGQMASQFAKVQKQLEKKALYSKLYKDPATGLKAYSGYGAIPTFSPEEATTVVHSNTADVVDQSSVQVEVVDKTSASHPAGRRLMSAVGDEEWGVTLPTSYHAVQLTQGQAQYGELAPNRVARYVYIPQSYGYDITFELSRRSGSDPNLYVSTSSFATLPFPHSSQWVSNFSGNDYITVDRMDTRKCAVKGCFYHIAVLIDGQQAQTGFTLTVSEGEALTDLQPGQVYANRLVANEPDYLRFVVQQPGQSVTFVLTDTGRTQPRAYISTTNRFPNSTSFQRSIVIGSDGNLETGFITINGQGGQSICTPSRTSPCYYYVQVISGNSTTYSIIATAGGSVELRNGINQQNRVQQNQYAYHRFLVSPGYTRFAVHMLLISGQANIYVSNSEALPVLTNTSSYVAARTYTDLYTPITIYENNALAACRFTGNSSYCTYTIAVFGVSQGQAVFALVATEGLRATVGLSNGVAIRQTMPVNGTYYWWAKADAHTRVQICVTVVSGTAHGYMSQRVDNIYPGPGNYDQLITLIEPGYFCFVDFDHPGGDIFLSLTNPSVTYGALLSVMFLQQFGNNDTSTMVQLSDGFPQAAILTGAMVVERNQQFIQYPANQVVYFNFLLSTNQQYLDVDLYAIAGDADVYMTFLSSIAPANQLQYPRPGYSQWAANLTGSDTIRVPNAFAGRYILGVFHSAVNPAVTVPMFLTVSSPLFPQSLQMGLGVRGYVGNNQYKYYQLQIVGTLTDTIELRLAPTRGNPDLYAARTTAFTTTTAIWRSAAPTGVDVISIAVGDANRPTNGSWSLYVAVHSPPGAGVSEFTLIASLSGGTAGGVFLTPNVAVPGVVTYGNYDYYKYRPTNLSLPVDVTIMRIDGGGPVLVASHALERPTTGLKNVYNNDSSSSSTHLYWRFPAMSTVPAMSCLSRNVTNPANCVYYLGVTVANTVIQNLTYTIQVGQPGDVTQLFDRTVQASQLAGRELRRYMYLNTQVNTRTVIFSVTAAVGDVDIYVSKTPDAGPLNFLWSSTGSGDDVIVIRNADSLYYYIGVQNKLNSTSQYNLLGRNYVPGQVGSGAWTLTADQSFNDAVGVGEYSYYYFNIAGSWPTLTISVNSRLGDPDIFVSHSALDGSLQWPNMTKSRWSSTDPNSDTLNIPNPPQGTLYIAVYGHPWTGQDVVYTISITGAGRTQVMYSGTTYPGELAANGYQFYQLTLSSIIGVDQLVFTLTSRTGDTNMYISDSIMNPSRTANNWTSEETQGALDLIVIRNASHPVTGRTELHVGTYYVGVYSSTSAVASFSLYVSQGLRTTLVDGRPMTQYLYSGGSQYFDAVYGRGQAFSVQTVATSGTEPLWVFVALTENIVIGRPATYLYSSMTNSSSVDLAIPGTACTTATCRYTILVYTPAAVPSMYMYFSISTQTATTITNLDPGVARGGSVTGSSYAYYTFQLNCPSNASLFLTAQTGNPDLLVNMGPALPTRQSFIWQSNAVGTNSDYVYLSPSSQYFNNRSMIGRYYVSVWGAQLTSTYTLVLAVDNQCGSGGDGDQNSTITYQALTNGQAQYGRVGLRLWLYYSFTITPAMWPTAVTFALSPTDGTDPDIYITKDGSLPSESNYAALSRESAGDNDIIYIGPNSTVPTTPCIPTTTRNCIYHIGVYGYEASSYTISASTTGTVIGLLMDTSRDGGVQPNGWQYYSVRVEESTQPLVVIVSPTSGNPDLYVEFNAQPTLQSLTSKTFGVDVITIAEPSVGDYRIGVFGAGTTFATYTVVASQRGIALRNGRPQDDALDAGMRRYYYFEFNEQQGGTRPFRLQIDAVSFNPQLEVYVRAGYNQVPSPTQSQYNLSSARGDALSLLVPVGSPGWGNQVTWRVLVISRTNNAVFAITAAQGHPPIFLTDGRATDIGESVAVGEYRYFRMLVLSQAYPITVTVTLQFGAAQLYVSTTEPQPGSDSSFLRNASGTGVGAVLTVVVPGTSLPGYVYAGVRTTGAVATRYNVLFSSGVSIVQANVPAAASCTAGSLQNSFVLYPPFNSSYTDDITMRISSAFAYNYTRPLAIYVTANASLPRASATANDWGFTLLDWNNPFTISRNDAKLQQCVDSGNCELHITVGCQGSFTTNLNYFFSVQIGASYIPLLAGQYTQGSALASEQDRYYSISTAGTSASGMQVRVDPCQGNAALFVNYARSGIPTAGNNDGSSMQTNRAQVVTAPAAPQRSRHCHRARYDGEAGHLRAVDVGRAPVRVLRAQHRQHDGDAVAEARRQCGGLLHHVQLFAGPPASGRHRPRAAAAVWGDQLHPLHRLLGVRAVGPGHVDAVRPQPHLRGLHYLRERRDRQRVSHHQGAVRHAPLHR